MEFVFVVPRETLFPECYPHGFVPFAPETDERNTPGGRDGDSWQARIEASIAEHGFYVERDRAERSPQWKQIIPYTLVVRDGQVLCLARTKKGGETRLHDKLSIGVGGHINPIDVGVGEDSPTTGGDSQRNPIRAASHREVLDEELHVQGRYHWQTLGLLNDDSNAVGAVHLGWVQSLVVEGDVQVREVDQLQGNFRTVDELREQLAAGANFETWSSLLIPHLDRLLSRSHSNASSHGSAPTEENRHPQSASSRS